MTQTRQREEDSPRPVARPRTAVLAERIPIRRIILVTLSILIAAGVLIGSFKTLTLTEGRISGAGWRDFLVFGVALGSIYALIALGYSLVYGILLMINFAHGEVFMMGAFASAATPAPPGEAGGHEPGPRPPPVVEGTPSLWSSTRPSSSST